MTETTAAEPESHRLSEEDNKLIAERRQKLAQRRAQGQAFPNHLRRDALAGDLQQELGALSKEELEALGRRAQVAGRVMRMRGPFIVIQDVSGQIQLYVDKKGLEESQRDDIKTWDLGDLVYAQGVIHKSGKGDLYVHIEHSQLLTKSLRPLPDKFHGLADQEMRYRQRYVDLIVNAESRHCFAVRSKVISGIRRFMEARQFMEVETPMLQVIPGGATARPFVTHHNALGQDMYLRIAPELYLKRLVVGGFEKVYEINRNFRNEGLSTRHNPEFTMIEFYWAYADYRDLMDFTEALLKNLAEEVLGTTQVPYQGEVFEFGQPFQRLTMQEAIIQYGEGISAADLATREAAAAVAERLKIQVKPIWGLGRIITEIFEEVAEHQLRQPTFITEYPAEVSPLARRNDANPEVTDRFEFFIGGREIANGFSELNDAEDQRDRFLEQVKEKEAGDDEAMFYDADYIRALEYGLPPTAGEGIGIDRLVMLFTDSPSIRDVLLFPAMRPEAD
ncbi:lysine--tRNA ligase [Marinospirillum sp. MEB164]|uniref:Lysine--tRNA ligase n=1 Tax=Marinospirillum alkalitolerans TaxID=3123374 RepID=A0ABW8PU18_9GAMM